MRKAYESEVMACHFFGGEMTKKDRIEAEKFVRVLWHCTKCPSGY